MSVAPALDLSALPVAQRVAALALIEEVTALREITRRQEHLIAELNHALHGKRSEKLSEDERQLAFEELSIALAEVEAEKDARGSRADDAAPRPAPKRTIGNLPTALPRIEVVIEPENLDCPCGCGPLHRIGEDRTERLDIVPAQLRVIVTIRPRYACRGCDLWGDPGTGAGASDPGWAADGGDAGAGAGQQIRRPSSPLPPEPDPGTVGPRFAPRRAGRLVRPRLLST